MTYTIPKRYVLKKMGTATAIAYIGNVQSRELGLCAKEKALEKCFFIERSQAIREASRLAKNFRVSIAVEEA